MMMLVDKLGPQTGDTYFWHEARLSWLLISDIIIPSAADQLGPARDSFHTTMENGKSIKY